MSNHMISYTAWELSKRLRDIRDKILEVGFEGDEYRALQGASNRSWLLRDALSEWISKRRGCWYCWDDMKVVEEDREHFKDALGFAEEHIAAFFDDDNVFHGTPKKMSQPAVVVRRPPKTSNGDDDPPYDAIVSYDLVSRADGSVLLSNIKRCPYCGRDFDVVWGKALRNSNCVWDSYENQEKYGWGEIDKTPWDEDEEYV